MVPTWRILNPDGPIVSHPITQTPAPATHWPKAAASAAIFRDGKVLIGLRGKDPRRMVWSLPGGHIEPGEKAQAAAVREIHEETGVDAAVHGLAAINDVIINDEDGGIRAHYLLTIFYGSWLAGEPSPADDCADARFVYPDEIERFETTDSLPHFIGICHRKWLRHIGG